MSGERQVNVNSQSELDIGGRETCIVMYLHFALLIDSFLRRDIVSKSPTRKMLESESHWVGKYKM